MMMMMMMMMVIISVNVCMFHGGVDNVIAGFHITHMDGSKP